MSKSDNQALTTPSYVDKVANYIGSELFPILKEFHGCVRIAQDYEVEFISIWNDEQFKGGLQPLLIAAMVYDPTLTDADIRYIAKRAYGTNPIPALMEHVQLIMATKFWIGVPFLYALDEKTRKEELEKIKQN